MKRTKPSRKRPEPPDDRRIADLQAQLDARDETIRLLNEALSRALDELSLMDQAA